MRCLPPPAMSRSLIAKNAGRNSEGHRGQQVRVKTPRCFRIFRMCRIVLPKFSPIYIAATRIIEVLHVRPRAARLFIPRGVFHQFRISFKL